MMAKFLTKGRIISSISCAAQIYFFLVLGVTEHLLLSAMAYDCYVAICDPLHYILIMTRELCIKLVADSYLNIPVQMGQTYLVFSLTFCSSHETNIFFCDIPALLKLACVDTYRNKLYNCL